MADFRFYHISEHYIRYLHSIDSRVQYNKGQKRPYVGVVLSIHGVEYYVPLESPKPNHANISNGGPVLKLNEGKLGIMGFNNMIPVTRSCLVEFDFADISDEKYRMLLINQLHFCNHNSELITKRAETTYRRQIEGKIPLYRKICCNFRKLEQKSRKYNPNYVTKKATTLRSNPIQLSQEVCKSTEEVGTRSGSANKSKTAGDSGTQ